MRIFSRRRYPPAQLVVCLCIVLWPVVAHSVESARHGVAAEVAEPSVDVGTSSGVEQAAAEKAVEQKVEKAARQAAERAMEGAVETVAEKAAQKAVDKSVEEGVEKAAEEAVEKAVNKAAGAAVAKVAEKAAENAALKAEQKAKRPDEWRGPTKVYFLVFLMDIDAIDDAGQNFTANVYLRLRWQDRRLAHRGEPTRQIPLQSVWNPRVLLANQTGPVWESLPDAVQVEADGTVTYHQRYTGKLSQPLRLSQFPRDKQPFVIQFVAAGYNDDHLQFVPDTASAGLGITGGSVADELSLPDWEVLSYEARKMTYRPVPGIHTAGFGLRFEAERHISYYLWQVVLPLGVVVVMSWSAFWLGRRDVAARIGVATSSVLTLIAHRFILASLLPRLPYMTRMDYLTVGSTVLVMLTLIMVVAIAILETRNKKRLARRLDFVARAGFPLAFLLLLSWFLLGEVG